MWNGMKYGFGFAIGATIGLAVLKVAMEYTSKGLDKAIAKCQATIDELEANAQKEEE